ncbi:kinase domain-containing protein [Metarhizium rileyi]|uniref:Kinase domain-containing protein n=1 Tax=Metarhizium rileyi (strain RCEF 4871) TaxID=1649241 RepID=A0A166VY20_METRR|nr:kinase domain-containing protein [Metarhizium rileyi RCEF 4871]
MKRVISRRPLAWLYRHYKDMTDGTQYWRDQYLLERWADSEQPVVYYKQELNGYKLLKRLGDWCWLARNTQNSEVLTIKFLGRKENEQVKRELEINTLLQEQCQSHHVCTIKDSFALKHHLAQDDPRYRDVSFSVIAYPPTGTDFQMIQTSLARINSPLPLDVERRVQCIKEIVQGVTELHKLNIVHADIHPGNVALPAPPHKDIEALLKEQPVKQSVERKDGTPTTDCLPKFVFKPEDLGFGNGTCRIMDFGFSFQHKKGATYKADSFSQGAVKAIEFLTSETTAHPFKVDSWYMGQLIYYILTDGSNFMDPHPSNLPSHFRDRVAELVNGNDEFFNCLPTKYQLLFKPIILQLMHHDPIQRLSIKDVKVE